MRVFVAEKERFAVHLRPEDLAALLAATGDAPGLEEVTSALDALARDEWGNLLAFPDTSRVSTLEDFRRRRMIYQMSQPGEAAERALEAYDLAFGRPGELQAVALEHIATQLRELSGALAAPDADSALIHRGLITLTTIFRDLADNAAAFMGSVQRSIDLHDADLDAFVSYKDHLIGYIERFVQDLVVRGQQIAGLLTGFGSQEVERMCLVAGGVEAADRPPGDDRTAEDEQRLMAEGWHERWRGLVGWFVDSPERSSEARLLRARARSAVPALLQIVAVISERQSGRSDRSTDFLALAEWFAALPDDASRHRLWRAAFGLTSSRHLSVTTASLEDRAYSQARPGESWNGVPPIAISARLRSTARYERRAPAPRVRDRRDARGLLEAQARAVAEQAEAARRRLAERTPARLSDLGELDQDEFPLLLALIGDAVAALGRGERAEVASSDGGLLVRITQAPPGARAAIRTPGGVLYGPDHSIDLVSVGGIQ
jgi:uncharacterized protein (TIGR02677 family)